MEILIIKLFIVIGIFTITYLVANKRNSNNKLK
jgi:hypothetical protein